MADYEKSVEKLQKDLKISKENYTTLNDELSKVRLELDAVREEKKRQSTNLGKMKTAIVKLKSELDGVFFY